MKNTMIIKRIGLLLFIIIMPVYLSAQSIVVKGIVQDITGEPLMGVNVVESGTTNGVITDIEGNYSLFVPSDAKLIFSFIGCIPQTVSVNKKTTINIRMKEDTKALEEVVVVGYGSIRKSDVSGSVASVDKDMMMKKVPGNLAEGLKGSAPGVMVTAQDGAPDANAAIRIRGVATINGSAEPLYVVDGVQVGTNANFLNPSDIESIEILKDASATAIYGTQGANGVIMITTKNGTKGALQLDFSVDFSVQTLAGKLDVCNVDQYAQNIRTSRINDGANLYNQIWSAAYDGKRTAIDWQDQMTQSSIKQQYNLSASGGTDKLQGSFSLSYLDNEGIVVNTNYQRLTARANIKANVNKFIEFGGSLNFVHSESTGSNNSFNNSGNLSSLRDMAFMCPSMDYVDTNGNHVRPNVVNPDGTYGTVMQGTNVNDGTHTDNIYANQMEITAKNRNNNLFASAYLDISLFKGLKFKTIASYTLSTTDWSDFNGNVKRYNPNSEGILEEVARFNYDSRYSFGLSQSQGNNLSIESYLTYSIKKSIHSLNLMVGNSVSKSYGSWVSASARDFPGANVRKISLTSDLTTLNGDGAYNLESRSISYFARGIYSLYDRYIVTATIRKDGSSNFGAGNRWGSFPSAAVAWRISEEGFMQDQDKISNFKVRLGWGQTGNSGGPTDLSVSALSTADVRYMYYPKSGSIGALGNSNANFVIGYKIPLVDTNLKWETNEQTNIGIDLGFLNNNLNVTADYFIRTSKDLLLYRAVRPSTGYSTVYTNYGEIENKGFEFSINYQKNINDWTFGGTFTGSTLKNKVKKMGADLFNVNDETTNDGSNVGAVGAAAGFHWDGHSICREGYAVGSFYGYQVEGIFKSQTELDAANALAVANGHEQYQNVNTTVGDYKYKDLNGDGFIDENDMTILGNGLPKLNYGINLNVAYKNWDISVYGYGVAGQKIYSYSAMRLSTMYSGDDGTIPNLLRSSVANVWSTDNPNGTLPRLTNMDPNYNMRGSSAWVKNGDYLKISNVQIGYTFSKSSLKALSVENARIYFAIQNLACISSYNKYGDPECGQGNVLYTGLDTGRYPQPRNYVIGLSVRF